MEQSQISRQPEIRSQRNRKGGNFMEQQKILKKWGTFLIREKKPLKASYTVEASFLMSITLFVLAALMICTFYLHDKAVMQAAVCEIASACSNMATEEEQNRTAFELKKSLTQKRLMGSRDLSSQVSTGRKVSASWSGNYPVPGLAMDYFTNNSLPIRVSWSSEKTRPADMIRKVRGIRKLISGGTE